MAPMAMGEKGEWRTWRGHGANTANMARMTQGERGAWGIWETIGRARGKRGGGNNRMRIAHVAQMGRPWVLPEGIDQTQETHGSQLICISHPRK